MILKSLIISLISFSAVAGTVVERFGVSDDPGYDITVYDTLNDFNKSKLETGYNVIRADYRGKDLFNLLVIVQDDFHTICNLDTYKVRNNLAQGLTSEGEASAEYNFKAHMMILKNCSHHFRNDADFKRMLSGIVVAELMRRMEDDD